MDPRRGTDEWKLRMELRLKFKLLGRKHPVPRDASREHGVRANLSAAIKRGDWPHALSKYQRTSLPPSEVSALLILLADNKSGK